MECERFRAQLGADPARLDEMGIVHERACAACAAYARRMRDAEHRLAAALRFDVACLKAASEPGRPVPGRIHDWPRLAAVAAVVVALGVWAGMRFMPTDDPNRLAVAVQDHWHHEPGAWTRTPVGVSPAALQAALDGQARVATERLELISYARSCLVNGRWVPHLVVQGRAGPVMLLLLPREPLTASVPLELPEDGLRGRLVPLGSGSVAILAEPDEPLDALEQTVSQAVEWTI